MLDWLSEQFYQFLEKFIGSPSPSFSGTPIPWSIEEIIRAECTHFFFSSLSGWLAAGLIWIILSSKYSTCADRFIFRVSLFFGVCFSYTIHIVIDGFTTLA